MAIQHSHKLFEVWRKLDHHKSSLEAPSYAEADLPQFVAHNHCFVFNSSKSSEKEVAVRSKQSAGIDLKAASLMDLQGVIEIRSS